MSGGQTAQRKGGATVVLLARLFRAAAPKRPATQHRCSVHILQFMPQPQGVMSPPLCRLTR